MKDIFDIILKVLSGWITVVLCFLQQVNVKRNKMHFSKKSNDEVKFESVWYFFIPVQRFRVFWGFFSCKPMTLVHIPPCFPPCLLLVKPHIGCLFRRCTRTLAGTASQRHRLDLLLQRSSRDVTF